MNGSRKRGRQGIALIATLAMLTLVSILLVAFVSIVGGDRRATQSYSEALHADQVALSGLDLVVTSLRSEITDSKLSASFGTGTNTLYLPIVTNNIVPQHMAAMPIGLASVIKWSGTNSPWYTPSTGNAATSRVGSSDDLLTTKPSLNGRSFTIDRWNKPLLMGSTNGFSAPRWILLNRNGPVTANAFKPSFAQTAADNMERIVGRYAFVVYDTSGLIDINVAGYPSGAAASSLFKGPLVWADLTQLTNKIAPAITTADINKMVAWRNATTALNPANYVTNVLKNATNSGFRSVASGDTLFLGRQELIKYAQTQNPNLTNALPFLTTFSREVNGPTWTPPTITANNASVLTNLVQTAGWTRQNGIPARVGESLVKYRFPLDKLALLEAVTDQTTWAANKAEIQKYFGLTYQSDSSGLYRHWLYTTPTGTTGATTILPLNQITGREPDFFELLQAGILQGSLGISASGARAGAGVYKGPADPDSYTTWQIIRIGANIIDQWDADSYPTVITFNSLDFAGIEDLPLLNKILLKEWTTGPDGAAGSLYNYYLYYELWNPHQLNPASTSTQYPSTFRIAPAASDTYKFGFSPTIGGTRWEWDGTAYTGASTFRLSSLSPAPQNGAIQFKLSDLTGFREPGILSASSATSISGNAALTPWNPADTTVVGLKLASLSFPASATKNAGGTSWGTPASFTCFLDFNLTLNIQFQDANGNWHTYGSFGGPDISPLFGGFETAVLYFTPNNTASTSASQTFLFMKSDPRTWRSGPSVHLDFPGTYNGAGSLTSTATTINGAPTTGSYLPFGASCNAILPYRLDMWAVNDSTVTIKGATSGSLPWYKDADGIIRGGDSKFSYSTHSPFFTGDTAARPILINRPFRSVGELGYAFRDKAWKTLDLFTQNSADAGLLDLFTLSGNTPLQAGRVNPNTPFPQVLASLLSGAQQNVGSASTATNTISTAAALDIARQVVATTTNAPFLTRADIVTRFMTNSAIAGGTSTFKTDREAIIRAIAEPSNTRTWNFLVDLVAQSGSYPPTSTALNQFNVTGQRRYWLHIAIDRYTGQIIDKQLESISE